MTSSRGSGWPEPRCEPCAPCVPLFALCALGAGLCCGDVYALHNCGGVGGKGFGLLSVANGVLPARDQQVLTANPFAVGQTREIFGVCGSCFWSRALMQPKRPPIPTVYRGQVLVHRLLPRAYLRKVDYSPLSARGEVRFLRKFPNLAAPPPRELPRPPSVLVGSPVRLFACSQCSQGVAWARRGQDQLARRYMR